MKIENLVWLMMLSGSLIQAASNFVWACGDTVQDIEGNTYNTVLIGAQCWMKENLKVTKNPSGITIIRYCYDDATGCGNNYGGLYAWNTAMDGSWTAGAQGICPAGWHIPTDAEFKILVENQATAGCESSTGMQCSPAGANLKSGGTSGFEGLLAGYRNDGDSFDSRGSYTSFWSSSVVLDWKDHALDERDSTPYTPDGSSYGAWRRSLFSHTDTVFRLDDGRALGFSVRCLKD